MTKNEFVAELNQIWEQQEDFGPMKVLILEYLIWYFDTQVITPDGCLPGKDITPYLPSYLSRAFELLRISPADQFPNFRTQLTEITAQGETPSLIEVSRATNKQWGEEFISYLTEILIPFFEKYSLLVGNIITYLYAQDNIITQAYTELFIRKVYQNGLYSILQEHPRSGFHGKFRNTTLACFRHPQSNELLIRFSQYNGVKSISFFVPDNDPRGVNFNLGLIKTEYIHALIMMDEVARHWPDSRDGQKIILKRIANPGCP